MYDDIGSDSTDLDRTDLDLQGRAPKATLAFPGVTRPPAFPMLSAKEWMMVGVLAATVAEDAWDNGNVALAEAYEDLARKCDLGAEVAKALRTERKRPATKRPI